MIFKAMAESLDDSKYALYMEIILLIQYVVSEI